MADLKLGTTVGGSGIWHQGNFPLVPTGNTLTYNGYKVYTENDKPLASNNDFVSKASGGQYLGAVSFKAGLYVNASFTAGSDQNGIFSGTGDGAGQTITNMNIQSWYGLGITSPINADGSTNTSGNRIWINTRTGDINTVGSVGITGQASVTTAAPTLAQHLTRKDYVDGSITTLTTNVNTRVLRSGDTMTGALTATNLYSTNAATQSSQVPRLDQVIVKGTTIDFGTF